VNGTDASARVEERGKDRAIAGHEHVELIFDDSCIGLEPFLQQRVALQDVVARRKREQPFRLRQRAFLTISRIAASIA
jgi:hypothetical protein